MDLIDFERLIKLSDVPDLNTFLHQCIDELIQKSDKTTKIQEKPKDREKAKICVQNFYRDCILQKKFDLDDTLNNPLRRALKDCYETRKGAIFQALAKECVLQMGYNLVQSFDWRLKWVLGSSSLASLKKPIVQVDLMYGHKDGEETSNNIITFEANLEKVEALIEELSKVKSELSNK